MMLKSLEKLKDTLYYDYDPLDDAYKPVDTDDLADEIQAEIDRFYLPRPLFEDGEPADSIWCVPGGVDPSFGEWLDEEATL